MDRGKDGATGRRGDMATIHFRPVAPSPRRRVDPLLRLSAPSSLCLFRPIHVLLLFAVVAIGSFRRTG